MRGVTGWLIPPHTAKNHPLLLPYLEPLLPPVSCSCFHKISHLRLPIKPQGCKRRKAQEESIAVLICAAWNSKQKGDGNIHNIWPVNCAKNTARPKSTWSAQCAQKRWRCMLWNGLCLKSNARDLHARFSSFLQSSCHSGETAVLWLKRLKARRSCTRCLVLPGHSCMEFAVKEEEDNSKYSKKSREQWPHLSLNAM